jgi:hypothetical protein
MLTLQIIVDSQLLGRNKRRWSSSILSMNDGPRDIIKVVGREIYEVERVNSRTKESCETVV